jgi:hypothetical protein
LQIAGQHISGEAWLLLVEIDGDDVKVNGGALSQGQQDVQQGVAVLATGQAHHDFVTVFDHPEVGDSLADLTVQALAEFVGLECGFARSFVSLVGCACCACFA